MDSGRLLSKWHLKVLPTARSKVLYKRLSALYLLTGQQTPEAAFGVSRNFAIASPCPNGLENSGLKTYSFHEFVYSFCVTKMNRRSESLHP